MLSYLILPLSLLGIIAIAAMGLQLILGGAGLLTLGHTAFFAIGGYASAAFTIYIAPSLGIEHPALLLLIGTLFAMFLSALAAVIVAIPCLRLRGDYLAVATMGFGQIVENTLNNIAAFGGASGFTNIPHLTHIGLIWAMVLVIGLILKRFYGTGIGYAILCSRDDEIVARCFGISPEKSKLIAFITGNMITGLAGAFYVHTFQFISPVFAGFQKSVEILLAVVIGGMFSIWGSLIGAAILVLVPEFLRFLPHHFHAWTSHLTLNPLTTHIAPFIIHLMQNSMLIFSIIVLLIIRKNPSGLNSLLHFLRRKKCDSYS
jgi:branched-chain amino acid transport system permease protein